jgi:hypothetical protein
VAVRWDEKDLMLVVLAVQVLLAKEVGMAIGKVEGIVAQTIGD